MTTTPHYSYTLPVVGGSQNAWGGLLNTIIGSIDSNIWSAAEGTTIGINAPSASGSNIVLTNPISSVQNISFSTTGKSLVMPAMNATQSMVVAGKVTITNVGSNSFSILATDDSTVIYGGLLATGSITAAGTLYVNGSYTNVPLTGGTGSGATANIVVSGNAVASVVPVNPGEDYVATDVLSASNANLGGAGSGFQYTVSTISGLAPGATVILQLTANGTANGTFSVSPKGNLNSANNLLDVANIVTALNNILPNQSGNNGLALVTNGTSASWALASGFSTGDVKFTLKTTADSGWIMANDGAIGDASFTAAYVVASISSISSGGSGYAIGDYIWCNGGFTAVVTAVSGSTVSSANMISDGLYSSSPTSVSQTSTSGSGTGAGFAVLGGALSSGVINSNAANQALFDLLWNNIPDIYAPVSGGRGSTAAADWSANKGIRLTKMLGRTLALAGSGINLNSYSLGQIYGDNNLQQHTHTDAGHEHSGGLELLSPGGQSASGSPNFIQNTDTGTGYANIQNTGVGYGQNMQPTNFLNAMIKL